LNYIKELNDCINESQRSFPIYFKMANSLKCGEALYTLTQAKETRDNLLRQFRRIGILCDDIVKNQSTSKDQNKLKTNIRNFAINYLKENSFNLPNLPTQQEYIKLRNDKQYLLQQEMKRLELIQLEQRERINDHIIRTQRGKNQSTSSKQPPKISIEQSKGWTSNFKPTLTDDQISQNGDNTHSFNPFEEQDFDDVKKALTIQIKVVQGYLAEALKQKKYEEAELLKQNLKELENNLQNS
jgi:hypothetical protein